MIMTVLVHDRRRLAALAVLLSQLKARLELSLAKHRSLTGHARMARRSPR